MKKIVLFLIAIGIFCSGSAKITTKQWTLKNYGTYNVVIYTPDNTGNKKLPCFVFIPGNGEVGSNIDLLYLNGPLSSIRNGWKPNFIIVAIQPVKIWPLKAFIKNALDSLKNPIYNVDFNKLVLTGLSGGAAAIWDYMQTSADADFIPPSAVIPFSYLANCLCGDFNAGTDKPCGNDLRFAKTACWGLCGKSDSFYGKELRYCQRLTEAAFMAKFTGYSGGHCCWNTYYDSNWKENGMSIYEWALQFPLTTLPVEFTDFYYQSPYLIWKTGSEVNNDYFVVEKSTDGLNFTEVGRVLPSESKTYKFKL